MKINNASPPIPIKPTGQGGSSARTQEPAANTPAGSTSSVGHANAALMDTTHDIDNLRLEEVKQAILDGKLEIDAGKIAEGLLANLKGT